MSVHILSNLLNKFGKSDKMQGLQRILSLFRKEFDKFNYTGARMLDSIYNMALKLFCYHFFGVKTSAFGHIYATLL